MNLESILCAHICYCVTVDDRLQSDWTAYVMMMKWVFDCCVHMLIAKDSERNHSMGSPMDGTGLPYDPKTRQRSSIQRQCVLLLSEDLSFPFAISKVFGQKIAQIVFDLMISIRSSDPGESCPLNSPCCDFAHLPSLSTYVMMSSAIIDVWPT